MATRGEWNRFGSIPAKVPLADIISAKKQLRSSVVNDSTQSPFVRMSFLRSCTRVSNRDAFSRVS